MSSASVHTPDTAEATGTRRRRIEALYDTITAGYVVGLDIKSTASIADRIVVETCTAADVAAWAAAMSVDPEQVSVKSEYGVTVTVFDIISHGWKITVQHTLLEHAAPEGIATA